MGVNVNTEFLSLAERFLHCNVGSLPFIYLGLPVGVNPRRESTWKPLLESLARKLGVWRNRFISLGSRVVLLNSVLNSIPIFYLSFLKLPLKVWKQIVKLQRNFLWGGANLDRKIAWVSWDKLCRPKPDGGLGIRDLHAVNLALLGKWRWRLLSGGHAIWKDIIFARYGLLYLSPHFGGRPSGFSGASLWWKDVSLLGTSAEVAYDWFAEGIIKRVGDGSSSSFWFDPWVRGASLKFQWRRELSLWEIELLQALLAAIENHPVLGAIGSWSWRHDSTGIFSVKSAYLLLTAGVVPNVLDSLLAKDRVSTRQNLLQRRVIRDPGDALCAFCGASMEAVDHLLVTYDFISPVWKNMLGWLLIWHATVWAIWNSLNGVIFARGTVSVESLVDKVKLSSWKWYMAKNPGNICSFYEWGVQPILCWSR
ncbi:hypothetical protein TSUD_311800 [Trifolium subterraneum]|uniref:Reverse transcriptase zinc-binding domain-containing protein n=1 Tax=Trifolium subterraneum TaxID=3900 RepID=A0A2Z6MN62_TRISU|nr:hypothetical protein TSUD_311800 [Trifolium subterraneum]